MNGLEHLKTIYTEQVATDVANRISSLLANYRERIGSNDKLVLSEQDVLLITYGDTLADGRRPPLQVLHRFHQDYLAGIFDIVHILPFMPFSSDAGFSVIDYYAVRDDLGDWSDIEAMSRDCRIMADAVINHMSSESPWFRSFLANDLRFQEFFTECDPDEDLSDVVRPRTSPLLTRFEDTNGDERSVWTTFSADQVDLNYRNPDVLLAILDVLFFLIEHGIRLLRLDAVTYLWKEPGTSSANMAETHAIIKILRCAISALRRDVVVITETNVPHRENIAYFGDGTDEAHMVYNFALPPLIAHSFIQGNGERLSAWAGRLELPGDEACFLNFSASHDGVGVRPVEEILDAAEMQALVDAAKGAGGLVSSRAMSDGTEKPYELNCTFLDLISRRDEPLETTVARFVASQSIVLAMPGVPAVYIQSLLGTRNDLDRVELTGRARSINRSRLDLDTVTDALNDGESLRARVFDALTRLIRIRRQEAAFDPHAGFDVLDLGPAVFSLRRAAADGSSILCIAGLCGDACTVDIDAASAGDDLVSGEAIAPGRLQLAPYAIYWIKSATTA